MSLKDDIDAHFSENLSFPEKWLAGKTLRCHAEPGNLHHTVAEHTFGVLLILDQLHPDPSAELLRAALRHDLAERWVGDLPAPFKWSYRGIAAMHENQEELLLQRHFGSLALSAEDYVWLKWADMLDFYLSMVYLLAQGNFMAFEPFRNAHLLISERWTTIPKEIRGAAQEAQRWVNRLPALFELRHTLVNLS